MEFKRTTKWPPDVVTQPVMCSAVRAGARLFHPVLGEIDWARGRGPTRSHCSCVDVGGWTGVIGFPVCLDCLETSQASWGFWDWIWDAGTVGVECLQPGSMPAGSMP